MCWEDVVSDENHHERGRASKFRSTLEEGKAYHCQDCNRKIYVRKYDKYAEDSLIVHHVLRLLDGGTSDKENLALLCNDCHNKRHAGMKEKPQLPLFRKRRVTGYGKGIIYTEAH